MATTTETAAPMAPMMDTKEAGPIEKFQALLAPKKFIFLVFFRGHWCPFCMAYLRTLQSIKPQIEAAGGVVVIATAETRTQLPETRKSTGYDGEAIVDEENILAKHLKEAGQVDVAISEWKGYPKGMAQPAILVLSNSNEVLEKWAIVPSLMNLGGAKDRPELKQVWDNVQAKLNGKDRVHSSYKLIGAFNVLKAKIFG